MQTGETMMMWGLIKSYFGIVSSVDPRRGEGGETLFLFLFFLLGGMCDLLLLPMKNLQRDN